MTLQHFVRRTHLYMGLFLLPWVIMYGVSSIPLNHIGPQERPPSFLPVSERQFDAAVPPAGADLRPLGRQMMLAAGIEGGYGVYRANAREIDAFHPHFLHPIRIRYLTDEKRLVVEQRELTLRSFISGLHTRGGYDMDGLWDSVWAVFVDIASIGLLLWIASGIYMWWHVTSTRAWGWIALGAGAACFLVIIVSL
jgi:hypothetical protein